MQRILDAVSQPLELDGRELYVTATLGSSVYPDDGEEAEVLLQKANTAMYRSKGLGRNTFHVYSAQMSQQHSQKLELLAALRRAVDHQELLLHYQPRVDLGTGCIVGLEALVRWQHPHKGLVSPAEFIPLAEESGLIEPIGSWVLRAACAQARAWQDMGMGPLQMAVNLSARQFRHKGLALEVASVLERTALDSRLLELELTEGALMNDPQSAARIMRELKALGVYLSIDDFGTGYSSLSYLQRFPVDHLKIDRSFVRDLPSSSDDVAIARTVISLGQSLGMRVVAEGVESREQAAFLREQGCHEIQGFYFSPPLSAPACQALLLSGVTMDLAALYSAKMDSSHTEPGHAA
jgi:EAL domain-containing protein (putative c-di-GMP-specific phosphodiesterase class I)